MKMDDGKFSVTIFPAQLKKAREFRGYKTQAACCKEMNIHRQVWSLWELGTRVPTVAQLIKLVCHFDIDINYFFLEDAKPEDHVVISKASVLFCKHFTPGYAPGWRAAGENG